MCTERCSESIAVTLLAKGALETAAYVGGKTQSPLIVFHAGEDLEESIVFYCGMGTNTDRQPAPCLWKSLAKGGFYRNKPVHCQAMEFRNDPTKTLSVPKIREN